MDMCFRVSLVLWVVFFFVLNECSICQSYHLSTEMAEVWLWKLGRSSRNFPLLVLTEWTSYKKHGCYKI